MQVPTESAQLLYETLHDAGQKFELRDAGYYAIDSLRVEKAYRAWGHELSVLENPFEAGLSFTIDPMLKVFGGLDDFVHKADKAVERRLSSLSHRHSSPSSVPTTTNHNHNFGGGGIHGGFSP